MVQQFFPILLTFILLTINVAAQQLRPFQQNVPRNQPQFDSEYYLARFDRAYGQYYFGLLDWINDNRDRYRAIREDCYLLRNSVPLDEIEKNIGPYPDPPPSLGNKPLSKTYHAIYYGDFYSIFPNESKTPIFGMAVAQKAARAFIYASSEVHKANQEEGSVAYNFTTKSFETKGDFTRQVGQDIEEPFVLYFSTLMRSLVSDFEIQEREYFGASVAPHIDIKKYIDFGLVGTARRFVTAFPPGTPQHRHMIDNLLLMRAGKLSPEERWRRKLAQATQRYLEENSDMFFLPHFYRHHCRPEKNPNTYFELRTWAEVNGNELDDSGLRPWKVPMPEVGKVALERFRRELDRRGIEKNEVNRAIIQGEYSPNPVDLLLVGYGLIEEQGVEDRPELYSYDYKTLARKCWNQEYGDLRSLEPGQIWHNGNFVSYTPKDLFVQSHWIVFYREVGLSDEDKDDFRKNDFLRFEELKRRIIEKHGPLKDATGSPTVTKPAEPRKPIILKPTGQNTKTPTAASSPSNKTETGAKPADAVSKWIDHLDISMVMPKRNLAMINGQPHHVGETLDESLDIRLTAIEEGSRELVFQTEDGREYRRNY